ncbi:TetR/AcrR family transcriptional regulator [Actinokineospora sp. NBRC 105648]|uniref:TetR/AcrR family transcriptional regulator n=1 Tax=Actinokineospora sp. NBRC 105648 TaxID=3032206 RepID=UPI0024A338E5|nr:TetR/AcrR family transcriptional regulator [Actinokineospora sp. NBRC 105648]GLZ42122.1 TetR family transcriptional regulator [Actinokineospora sp. NBRC 105648]
MGHREQLIVAARRLLEDKGYAHITARDLVATSGTNLASIGYHFGSKAGLLNEALGVVFEEWTTQLAEVAMADPNATPIGRAHLTWATVLRNLEDKRALLLSFVEALAQADRDPALREQLAAVQHRTRTRIAEMVARSYGSGISAEDPRCMAVAGFVLAVCDGLAMQWLLDPTRAPKPDDLLHGLSDLVKLSQDNN